MRCGPRSSPAAARGRAQSPTASASECGDAVALLRMQAIAATSRRREVHVAHA